MGEALVYCYCYYLLLVLLVVVNIVISMPIRIISRREAARLLSRLGEAHPRLLYG